MNRKYTITISLSDTDIEQITEDLHQRLQACRSSAPGYPALDVAAVRAWNQVYLTLTGQEHPAVAAQFGAQSEVAR